MAIAALSGWTSEQKHVVAASFLGWSLDAFDFFLLVFVLKDIAAEFHTDISNVTLAILLTLAMRPIGAFIFGRAADRSVPQNSLKRLRERQILIQSDIGVYRFEDETFKDWVLTEASTFPKPNLPK